MCISCRDVLAQYMTARREIMGGDGTAPPKAPILLSSSCPGRCRRLRGRVEADKIGGGNAYDTRGELEIDEDQAEIVRRIVRSVSRKT